MTTHIAPVKDRLLVVLGAGSTIHAGAPSTTSISQYVNLSTDATIASVVKALGAQRGTHGFGFETILACLEELDEFDLRKKASNAWDRAGGFLSAFADLYRCITPPSGSSFLGVRFGLLNALHKIITQATDGSKPGPMGAFLARLSQKFDLTVVTLNYDDIIDRLDNWFDGFCPTAATSEFDEFNTAEWLRKSATAPAILIHLHGSVRFGFAKPQAGRAPEIVRYRTAGDAKCSLIGWAEACNGHAGAPLAMPLISGQRKDRWMTRGSAPFPYYYNAFTNAALNCSRVLVAGYGGHDPHISYWLDEVAAKVHGKRWRIVCLDSSDKAPTIRHDPNKLVLGGTSGYFPPRDCGITDEILGHLRARWP